MPATLLRSIQAGLARRSLAAKKGECLQRVRVRIVSSTSNNSSIIFGSILPQKVDETLQFSTDGIFP